MEEIQLEDEKMFLPFHVSSRGYDQDNAKCNAHVQWAFTPVST